MRRPTTQIGGYRATAATSDRHAAQVTFRPSWLGPDGGPRADRPVLQVRGAAGDGAAVRGLAGALVAAGCGPGWGVAVPGGLLGAEVSGDLLLGFARARVPFGPVRAEVSAGRTRTGAAVAQVLRRWPGGRLRVSGIHPAQLLASCLQDGG
jgi:hypothetical protein